VENGAGVICREVRQRNHDVHVPEESDCRRGVAEVLPVEDRGDGQDRYRNNELRGDSAPRDQHVVGFVVRHVVSAVAVQERDVDRVYPITEPTRDPRVAGLVDHDDPEV
jgi:hypothetical protein